MASSTQIPPRILNRHNAPLHYWLSGSAEKPLIVCTHGAGVDHHLFDAQIDALSQDYHVLTWDVRGHGQSQPIGDSFSLELCAEDLFALMDAVGVEKAILMGQSMGGYISQIAYRQHPERIRGLVVIGATNLAKPLARWEAWALKLSMPLIRAWPYDHFLRTAAHTAARTESARAMTLNAMRQIKRADFMTIWEGVTLVATVEGWPGHHIHVPFLLTHGEFDVNGTIRRDAPGWAAVEPDVRYEVIPNAAHNANQDNPAAFNRVLLDFLSHRLKE